MKAVELFEQIRDIPYMIPLSASQEDNCCSGKAARLKRVLEEIGYETRYRVCDFQWSNLPLPEALLHIPHESNSTHVYLEVKIDETWIDVDPTWDPGLKHVFPIATWDGRTGTKIAVKPLRLYSHGESRRIMEEPDPIQTEKDLEKNGVFYKKFNEWLESQRV